MKKQKKLAIAGITGAMLIGAGTGVVLGLPSGAGASNGVAVAPPTTEPSATATTPPSNDPGTNNDSGTDNDSGTRPARPDRGAFLKAELDKLVTAGTITQQDEDAIIAAVQAAAPAAGAPAAGERGGGIKAQLDALVTAGTLTQAKEDAIVAALQADRPAGPGFGQDHGGPGKGGKGGMGGQFGRGFGMGLDAAATAIGITTDELKTELQSGKTIAAVATEHNVDVQKVIDAIVAAETTDLTQRVTDMVNGVKPTPPAGAPSNNDQAPTTTTG